MTSFNRKDQALQWIKLSALSVRWPQAQRPFDERRAKKIAAAFNPDSFTPVIVSLPDAKGMHHIIDGQHRCGAARIALGADQSVPCEVVNVDTPEDAARIFGVINNDRAAVSAIDKFRNAVTEGRPLHVAVEKLLTQMGYRIATGKGEGIINAIGTCVLVAEQHRTEGLRDTLLMIQGAWAKECGSVDKPMIRGMAAFLAKHGAALDRERLARKLAKDFTAIRFLGQVKARADTLGCHASEAMEGLLISIYDEGLRSGRLGRKEFPRAA